jgi:nucleoside-diphosphate-sugar epimerase
MANVLVTGASGLIGMHLTEALLARGHQVACLVRKSSPLDHLRSLAVELLFGDVTEPDGLAAAVDGRSVVYHVAGIMQPYRIADFYRVNTEGSRNVAAACAAAGRPPVLVYVSSQTAAGPAREGRPVSEQDIPRPVCHYGRSKLAGEQAMRAFAERVPITIVRPAAVFGQRERGFLAFFKTVKRWGVGVAPVWPTLGIDVIHVADLVDLLIRAAEQGARAMPVDAPRATAGQGVYFAAVAEHIRLAEMYRLIGLAVGRRRVAVVPLPAALGGVAAVGSELVARLARRPPLFGLDRAREMMAGSWHCSPQAAIHQLGFQEGAPLVERFHQTASWYREQGCL